MLKTFLLVSHPSNDRIFILYTQKISSVLSLTFTKFLILRYHVYFITPHSNDRSKRLKISWFSVSPKLGSQLELWSIDIILRIDGGRRISRSHLNLTPEIWSKFVINLGQTLWVLDSKRLHANAHWSSKIVPQSTLFPLNRRKLSKDFKISSLSDSFISRRTQSSQQRTQTPVNIEGWK